MLHKAQRTFCTSTTSSAEITGNSVVYSSTYAVLITGGREAENSTDRTVLKSTEVLPNDGLCTVPNLIMPTYNNFLAIHNGNDDEKKVGLI